METSETPRQETDWRSPFWWFRWVPTAVISVIVLYVLYTIGSVVLLPVLASIALAYLLNPFVQRLQSIGLSRAIGSFVAILTLSLAVTAFVSYVVPEIWSQTSRALQTTIESFTPENAARQRAWLRRYSPALERVAGDKIEQFLSDPVGFYNENVAEPTPATIDEEGKITPGRSGGAALFSTLVSSLDLLLVPFFVFYILLDFPRWRDSLEGLIPPRYRDPFSRLFDESGRILESYVRGQLLIALIMAVLYAVGFWFMGVPAWAAVAVIAGFLNVVPYIGSAIGIVLASVLTFATGGGVWDIAGVIGVFAAVQTIEGYILTPKILGGRLNLHPMAVFIGLLAGGKLFGILGIILTIPAIAIIKVFLKFGRELYLASSVYRGDVPHPSSVETPEERVAQAADSALAEQVSEDPDSPARERE
jgi:predicted PurR-regulated permease PerM